MWAGSGARSPKQVENRFDVYIEKGYRYDDVEKLRESSRNDRRVVVLNSLSGVDGGGGYLYHDGTIGAPTAPGDEFAALAAGTFFNDGGYSYKWCGDQAITVLMFGAQRGGVVGCADAVEAADEYCDRMRTPLVFLPGSYRLERSITRKTQSAWVGPSQQSNTNINNEVQLVGVLADIGAGNAMIYCSAGVSVQSMSFANLDLVSDKSIDFGDLAAATDSGVVLVDISNVKDGLEFVGCAFRGAWHGVRQADTDPYLDKVTFSRCHFSLLYRVADASPTAGLHFANCFFYNCVDFVDSLTDVYLSMCSVNNSSFATERTAFSGRSIVMDGGWIEGGNRVIRPSVYAEINGVRCSETMSASGTTKFLIEPQNDNVTVRFIGSRVPTNTRLIDLSGVSVPTITVCAIGAYDGTNFSDAASITSQLTAGLQYEGYGNQNSALWNVQQINRKLAVGTKRNPERQLEVQNDGGGSGVYIRVTDTAAASGIAGLILERSQTGASDFKVENNAGELVVYTATDGATWTPIFKLTAEGALGLVDGIAPPDAQAGWAFRYVDSTDGDYKIRYGDGVTKTLAVDT